MTNTGTVERQQDFPIETILAATDSRIPVHPDEISNLASHLLGREVNPNEIQDILPHLKDEIIIQHDFLALDPNMRFPDFGSPLNVRDWLGSTAVYAGDALPLAPISDREKLTSIEIQIANGEVRTALIETVLRYHLKAEATDGSPLYVPAPYQIQEPGFRPFKGGKASPEELQAELDSEVEKAKLQGINLGLHDEKSLKKMMLQLGLGIDCSNFAFRFAAQANERLGLPPYESTVFKSSEEILNLYRNGRWPARNPDGTERQLTGHELAFLTNNSQVPVDWVCEVFGKQAERITAARQICADNATRQVTNDELLPGDLVTFTAPSDRITHVAVIDEVTPGSEVSFWHSWHTRNLDAGLRRDTFRISENGEIIGASHPGLEDVSRYKYKGFRRPNALAKHYESLKK